MGQAEDSAHEKQNWHWRNSMRPVRFFNMDARVCIIIFGLMPFWAHPWAMVLVVLNVVTFIYLEGKGLTFPSAIRRFRSWVAGVKRPAWLSYRRCKLTDYG